MNQQSGCTKKGELWVWNKSSYLESTGHLISSRPFFEGVTEVCTNTRMELNICIFIGLTTTGRKWRTNVWFISFWCSSLLHVLWPRRKRQLKTIHLLENGLVYQLIMIHFQPERSKHFIILIRFSRYHKPLDLNQLQQ